MNGRINKPQSALLLGAGYTASHLAPALISRGYAVTVTTRDGQTDLDGVKCLAFDGEASDDLRKIFQSADMIVTSIPPHKDGSDPALAALGKLIPSAKWIAYLSATSVYGDRQGRWAFEGEAPTPGLKRGKARAEAEIAWVETGWPVHIFRLAGIYGPGRSPFDKLRQGKARAVIKEGQVVNRIHVDDIVSALLLSSDKPNPQAIYNLADGNPAPPQDVLDYAAQLLDLPPPPRVSVGSEDVSDMARTFYAECKRISIDRATHELGFTPTFYHFQNGLKAILKAEG
ncbi:SDR family oxidoreductase [Litorimonas sp. WD9-15]|uniref:SDR family oxidoreductase n=1 Tax=Litorimonas sp. WD9-15 TaxID=3418716 RepID=UPI003D0318CF